MWKYCDVRDILLPTLLQNLHGVKRCPEHSTAVYNAILQNTGDVIFGVGDFNVHKEITPEYVSYIMMIKLSL